MKSSPSSVFRFPEYLRAAAERFFAENAPLTTLLSAPDREQRFVVTGADLRYDYTRQRMDSNLRDALFSFAADRKVMDRFYRMTAGDIVNPSENRSALHTAARRFSPGPLYVPGGDVMPDIRRVRDEIRVFSEQVRNGGIVGQTGRPFRHIVVIGIGGSYLGTEFVARSLFGLADGRFHLHFCTNVDSHDFDELTGRIDPETTLWIVVSKSFTTVETLKNAGRMQRFLRGRGLSPARHTGTVTAKGSPGDNPETALATFHMFDFIGGRYSVTSAVGGVPLSLFLGYETFERFLKGAAEMDEHATTAEPARNLPLTAALVDFANARLLGYGARAIVPYAMPLEKLTAHYQQLYMESMGKSVDDTGKPLPRPAGVVVFGEPGTNAQHSFFQSLHQGPSVPVEFIGVIKPRTAETPPPAGEATHHRELWANLLAQATGLVVGRADPDPAKRCPGNRPSSILALPDLRPETVGKLLSYLEAKTVFEGFLHQINPFDQFGVETGKVLAASFRKHLAGEPGPETEMEGADPGISWYLARLSGV